MDRSGLRVGIAIGGLAVAVLGLGALVVVLVTNDDSSSTTTVIETSPTTSTTTTSTEASEACPVTFSGGPAKVDLGGQIDCGGAKAILAGYQAKIDAQQVRGSGGFADVGDWTCHTAFLADYPDLAECTTGGLSFKVVGAAPSAHSGSTDTTVNGRAQCGNLGGSLANNVGAIKATGADCAVAIQVVQSWLDAGCGAKPAGTRCAVTEGFTCVLRSVAEELAAITCQGPNGRAVRFQTGA